MSWVMTFLVVAVIGVAVALAVGRGGQMRPEPVDRPVPHLPAGELTAADLEGIRFPLVTRGYDPAQVDAVMKRLADQLTAPVGSEEAEQAQAVAVESDQANGAAAVGPGDVNASPGGDADSADSGRDGDAGWSSGEGFGHPLDRP